MKFPKNFFESFSGDTAKEGVSAEVAQQFLAGQKRDYDAALHFAEDNIANLKDLKELSAANISQLLQDLNKIATTTLLTHPAGNETGIPGKLRSVEVYGTKVAPEEGNGREYNTQHPEDIFLLQLMKGDLKTATHFLKWYAKWQYNFPNLAFVEKHLEMVLKANGDDVAVWKRDYFQGKTLTKWLAHFFANEGKAFVPAGLLNNFAIVERALAKGLYTQEEEAARDTILKFYPLSATLPAAMQEFSTTLVEMLKNNQDPIQIAAFAHSAITQNHFSTNGNGRVARIFMNALLMHHNLPLIYLEGQGPEKIQYYKAVEAGDIDLKTWEEFVRSKVNAQIQIDKEKTRLSQLSALGVVAKTGNTQGIETLLAEGVAINGVYSAKDRWTALHYACAMGKFEAAELLVRRGADISFKNSKGQTPLDLKNASALKVEQMEKLRQLSIEVAKLAKDPLIGSVEPAQSVQKAELFLAFKPDASPVIAKNEVSVVDKSLGALKS